MNVFLLRAVRSVIRADSDPVRQVLFANLRQSWLPLRMVFRVHELLGRTSASGLLVSLYGLAFFLSIAPPRTGHARILIATRNLLPPVAALPLMRFYLAAAVDHARASRSVRL